MALNEQEKYFLASIVDKIKTYQIATNLKEAFSRRSGIFATTTYNNGEEEIVDTGIEIFLASKSFYYWLHKYAIVEIPGSGNFPMEPYHFQTEFAKEIEQYRKIVTLKTRQAGISTFSSFYCLWRCTFKKSENIDVVSTKQLKAQQFVKKMKPTMKAMPEWMKPKVKNENTQMIVWEFPDGATSQILSESQSENAGRGDSLSLLVLDEVAFYQSDKMVRTIISSAQPTLTKTGGQLLLISCVKKDTYIYTDKGLQQVQDFIPDNCKPGYNKIPEFKIDGINHKQISSTFYDSGITPTKKIHLQNGIVNEISEIHPFYVIDETSPFPYFKQTKDIKAGDYSLASCREKTFGNNDYFNFEYKFESHRDKYNIQNFDNAITEDMSYFFGLLIGDGFIDFSNQCCIITSNDEETQNWLLNNPHFNCVREIRKDDDIHFRLQGKYLITLLKKLGFTKQKAKNKIIPKRLLQLSRKNTAALLRGLFDSDGHSRTRDGSIGFTSTSEELLKQVKLLLDMFGIQISDERWNYIDPKKSTRVNVVSHVGQITMSRYFSKIFYEKIGFNIKRKQEKYESVKHIEYSSSQSYPDIKFWIRDNLINKYVDKTLQKNLSTDKRKDWEHPSRILRYESNDKTTRNNIKKILDYYDGILSDKEEYQRLLDFYNKDWYLLEVKKIENGKEHTYDFVIPETRSFYANGVIGSNTPNGISGSGAYYYEQIQAILTTKPKDSKLVQIDWWMIPDDPMIKGSKKGFNKILENAITEDYYNNPAILKKYRDIFEPIAREPKLNPWLKAQLEDLQDVKYKQEILHEFILSGNKVFNEEELERVFNRIKEPVEKDRFKGRQVDGLWFWKTPKEGKRYIMSCLPEGEFVLTDKGVKKIEDVKFSDYLIDKNGNNTKIINKQITKVKDEKILEINVSNIFRKTKFTGNHPILSSKDTKMVRNRKTGRRWLFEWQFNNADNLSKNDWLVYPNIYFDKEISEEDILEKFSYKTKRFDFDIEKNIILDEDFWWYIGLWLAEGWTSKLGYSKSISTAHNLKEEMWIYDKIKHIFSKYQRKPSISLHEKTNSFKVIFNSGQIFEFLNENFGKYADGKKIAEWVKYIPNKFKLKLVEGYLVGDGCYFKPASRELYTTSFVSISQKLLEDFQDILFSLGYISSMGLLRKAGETIFPDGKIYKTKETYHLNLNGGESFRLLKDLGKDVNENYNVKTRRRIRDCFFSEDRKFIYFKIKDIKEYKYSGFVYNFETEDHSFLSKGITTHNCDIAKGTSNDYSSFQVFDVEDYEQVCEYKNLISTPAFSALIKDVARYYNEAYCVIESNGVGEAVFTKLYYDEYDPYGNLYKEFKKNKKGETIATGWTTTQASRLLITNTLIDWIKVEELFSTIKIYSSRTYNEMTTWIYGSGGRPIHVDGANDDLLISLALSLYNRHRAVNSGQSFLIAEDGKVLSYENSKNEEVEKGMFGLITSDNDTDDEGFTKEMADAYNWLISG